MNCFARSTIPAALLIAFTAAWSAAAEPEEKPSEVEPDFLSNVRQVTSGFVKAGEGYFSPDGEKIIYQAVPKGYPFYQIYTQPLKDGEPHRVSTGRGRTTCSYFHPTKDRILFASSHLDPRIAHTEAEARREQEEARKSGRRRRYKWVFDPHMDIFSADPDGGNLKRLTDAVGYDAEGAYSPDGKLIAFCSTRDGDPDLYVMNSDGTDVRQLTDVDGYDGGPFISPDGEWIIFRSDRNREEGYLQIYAISLDGEKLVQLTDNIGVNWAPYWHPTEPYIIWAGADHTKPGRPNYDLWLLKYKITDGMLEADGEKIRVTDHPAADVLPVFSPDGKRLMWTSNRTEDHSSQLFIGDFKLPESKAAADAH